MTKKIKLPVQAEVTTKVIDFVLKQHETEADRVRRLKNYYDNNNDILSRTMVDTTKPNNKLAHPYCAFITDMAVGHFLGVPVAYKTDNEELMNRLTEINDYNDEADNNTTIATWQSICGYGVELVYCDEDANVRYDPIEPTEIAIVYDNTVNGNIQFAVRYFDIPSMNESDEHTKQVEIYTNDKITIYNKKDSVYELVSENNHFFGQVPVCVYTNNNDLVGDFEKVVTLVDAYDKVQSDTANDFEYFTDAYLKITGATLDGPTAQELKEKRVINLPDSDSDASFLIKELNDTALENYKNRLKEDIHKFSFVPDITSEGFTSSISGEALKFKFSALNNICKTKQNKFKKGLMRRIELICNFLSIKNATEYTSIVPVFTLNMPKNETDIANMVKNLFGIVSHETLLSWIPGIEDPQFELEKLNEENSYEDEYSDLTKVKEVDVDEREE